MSSNPRIVNAPPGIPVPTRKGRAPLPTTAPKPAPLVRGACFPIVVHSHLRWSFVWQRPQHTHSRLAQRHPVLFVEEPTFRPGTTDHLEITSPIPYLWVVEPITVHIGEQGLLVEVVPDQVRHVRI